MALNSVNIGLSECFSLFPKLPIELRAKIWRHTFPAPTTKKIDLDHSSQNCISISNSTFPIALQINQESRAETLRFYDIVQFNEVFLDDIDFQFAYGPGGFLFGINTVDGPLEEIRNCKPLVFRAADTLSINGEQLVWARSPFNQALDCLNKGLTGGLAKIKYLEIKNLPLPEFWTGTGQTKMLTEKLKKFVGLRDLKFEIKICPLKDQKVAIGTLRDIFVTENISTAGDYSEDSGLPAMNPILETPREAPATGTNPSRRPTNTDKTPNIDIKIRKMVKRTSRNSFQRVYQRQETMEKEWGRYSCIHSLRSTFKVAREVIAELTWKKDHLKVHGHDVSCFEAEIQVMKDYWRPHMKEIADRLGRRHGIILPELHEAM